MIVSEPCTVACFALSLLGSRTLYIKFLLGSSLLLTLVLTYSTVCACVRPERNYVTSSNWSRWFVCVSVLPSVRKQDNLQSNKWICMKLLPEVYLGPKDNSSIKLIRITIKIRVELCSLCLTVLFFFCIDRHWIYFFFRRSKFFQSHYNGIHGISHIISTNLK